MTCDATGFAGKGSAGEIPDVAAIVLNYINYEETIGCVRDLLSQDYPALRCVVVDNASPNDSAARLQRAFHGEQYVMFLSAPGNEGYSAGNNLGARLAIRSCDPKYLLIINPDVRLPDKRTVARLVAFADSQADAGAVSPKVVLPSGFVQGPYKRPNLLRVCVHYLLPFIWYMARKRHQHEFRNSTLPCRCFRTIGACVLLRTEAFLDVGMFDEGTFMESEEPILAEKLSSRGMYFYHNPEVTVIHHHSRSGISPHTLNSLIYYFHMYRGAGSVSIGALRCCARFYEMFYHPLRHLLRFTQQ